MLARFVGTVSCGATAPLSPWAKSNKDPGALMTQFSHKWKTEKCQKKLQTAQRALLPGEHVWFLGVCNNMRPLASELALTNVRVLALSGAEVKFEARYGDIASLTPSDKKQTVEIVCRDGRSMLVKMVPKADHGAIVHCFQYGLSTPARHKQQTLQVPAVVVDEARRQELREVLNALKALERARSDVSTVEARATTAKDLSWPNTRLKGKLSRKASEAIRRQCHGGEEPWLILTSSGGAGTLVAFGDRLAIIKTGALTSLMAGSLGGERSATFHFMDITGFEYNAGFVNGVLEVLTPSYSGTTNKDFWRGTNKSRNSDSTAPWTLSNCLPLGKIEYNSYLAEITELKSRVSKAKHTVQVVAPQPPAGGALVEQLGKLASLHQSGALSAEEFAVAKARLLG